MDYCVVVVFVFWRFQKTTLNVDNLRKFGLQISLCLYFAHLFGKWLDNWFLSAWQTIEKIQECSQCLAIKWKTCASKKKYLYTCLKIIFYSPFAKISLQFRLLKYLFQNTFYQMLIQVSEIQRISIKL